MLLFPGKDFYYDEVPYQKRSSRKASLRFYQSTFTVLPDIVRLPCVAGQQLHAFENDIFTTVHTQPTDGYDCMLPRR